MKRMVVAIMAVLLSASICSASIVDVTDMLSKIELRSGIGYSANDSRVNYLATIPVITLKNGFNIEVGYASDADESDHKAIMALSYPLAKFADLPWVGDVPILRLIELNVGGYIGYGKIDVTDLKEAKLDYGPSLTVLNLKF